MQLMRTERPLTTPGLTPTQRLSYAATLLGWFDAWRTLGFLVLPLAVLMTGAMPIRVDVVTFAITFLVVTLLQRIAMSALSRGFAPQGIATLFELIRLPANLGVGLTLFGRRSRRFVVTPKGAGDRRRQPVPVLLSALITVHVVAFVIFGVVIGGWAPWTYAVPGVAIGTAVFAVINLILLVVASMRIRQTRFAGDRRRGERFSLRTFARVGADVVDLVDISLTGALFITPVGSHGVADELRLSRPNGEEVVLGVSERSRHEIGPDGRQLVGVEFDPGQETTLATLSRLLFTTAEAARTSSGPASNVDPSSRSAEHRSGTASDAEHDDHLVGQPAG